MCALSEADGYWRALLIPIKEQGVLLPEINEVFSRCYSTF